METPKHWIEYRQKYIPDQAESRGILIYTCVVTAYNFLQ